MTNVSKCKSNKSYHSTKGNTNMYVDVDKDAVLKLSDVWTVLLYLNDIAVLYVAIANQ